MAEGSGRLGLARYRVLAFTKVLMPAACFIEGGEEEGSDDDLVVWVLARYRVLKR
jgi:hypothetical protein